MTSIPARRILATSAFNARTCLRASASAGMSNAISAPPSLRAPFSGVSCAATLPSQLLRRTTRVPSVRWSTNAATGSKIWTFEEIQSLSTDPATPKATIIDVREPGELRSTGRIPGAVNIPITTSPDSFHITEEEFEDRFGFERPEKDAEVVFYCKAGVRSRAAAGLAREAGWTGVGEFPGSWIEWSEKGGAVER
ncbi:Rhodanese-like domain-containing protein [Xylaria digitata]|nr:Rhodanese-like domain-containing protein [Xylaria digitata]